MKNHSLRQNALLSLATIVVLGLFLEAAFSLYYGAPHFHKTGFGVWMYKPSTTYSFDSQVESGEFDTTLSTNSLGFFDEDHALEKVPGKKRVLVLGDSFTEARQVNKGESFAYLVEERLGVEVLKFGVSDTGAVEYASLYENLGAQFNPDFVVVFFFTNDVKDAWKSSQVKTESWYSTLRNIVNNSRFLTTLLRALSPVVQSTEVVDGKFKWVYAYSDGRDADIEFGWRTTFEKLQELREKTRGRLAIAYIPDPHEVDGTAFKEFIKPYEADGGEWSPETPNERFKEFAAQNGIEFIELKSEIVKHSRGEVYFKRDGHLTKKGHEVVARVVAE